jgi:hypothetical protein
VNQWIPLAPKSLEATCGRSPQRAAWLARLPDTLRELQRRWSLRLGIPYDGDEVSCAWVAPVTLTDGTSAVLKVGMPHLEADHEIEGLRFWNGDRSPRKPSGALLVSSALMRTVSGRGRSRVRRQSRATTGIT